MATRPASLTTQPTLTTTATASSHVGSLRHHRQRRGRFRLHDRVCRRHPDRHHRGIDDHGGQPDQGLRRGPADAHRSVLGLRQRRHLGQPDDPAHADDNGHRQQPRLGQPLHHHRQRRGGLRLHDRYVAGSLTVTTAPLTITAEQPDQGLRRGAADADGQLTRASSMATPRPA